MYGNLQSAACEAMQPKKRDVSPIQAEIRAANDALDLLHALIQSLADRLGPVLIMRGAEVSGSQCGSVPQPQKSPLGREIESLADRASSAAGLIDEMLSCLHL